MQVKAIIQQYGKPLFLLFFLIAIVVGLFRLTNDLKGRSFILGNPDNIVVISPNESQDVVIIGDPEQVKVKPSNKK